MITFQFHTPLPLALSLELFKAKYVQIFKSLAGNKGHAAEVRTSPIC